MVLGDLVTAWESARGCAKAEIERKAAASASSSSQPPPVPRRDYLLMAAGFKQQEGKKPESELPGEPLMAQRLRGIEDNTPKAEPMTDIASLEDGEDEVVFAGVGISGALRAHHRKFKKAPAPVDAEQLRNKHKVLDNFYLYANFKHHNTAWLKYFHAGVFHSTLADFVLGKKVWKLEVAADSGLGVPWSAVLQ